MLIRATIAGGLCVAAGCSGGVPLLHAVHPLSEGQVQGGLGMSATVVSGSARSTIDRPLAATAPATAEGARGVAARGALAPGTSPWIAARAGLAKGNEVGLTYTGRAVRLDGRHVFEHGALGLSIGAGGSVLLDNRDDPSGGARWALDRSSLGVDIPVLLGWQSSAGIVSLYAGPRVGYEHIAGDVSLGEGGDGAQGRTQLRHWYAAGLVGLTLGFRHLHGALELQTTYHDVRGQAFGVDAQQRGISFTPAAALLLTF